MNIVCSKGLSWTLDIYGYSAQQRRVRRLMYTAIDEYFNKSKIMDGKTKLTVGSKGEGLTKYFESDMDELLLDDNLICADQQDIATLFEDQRIALMTEARKDFPGHVLILVNESIRSEYVVKVKTRDGNLNVLSSTKSIPNQMMNLTTTNGPHASRLRQVLTLNPRAGPSRPVSSPFIQLDMVVSIRYLATNLLYEWNARPRCGYWPSDEVRQSVIQLGANLVPTGCDGSDLKDHEWRICFNQGETLLVSSWNDCLTKVYILLKMLLKNVLKPEGKLLTSYVMKNIVFWLAEKHPQEEFTEENLYDWIVRALGMLQGMLRKGNVPYYMIPERNLLSGTGNPVQIHHMAQRIDLVVKAGPQVFFLLPKFQEGMHLDTVQLETMNTFRNTLEMRLLLREYVIMGPITLNMTFEEKAKTCTIMSYLTMCILLEAVSSNWRDQLARYGETFTAYAFGLMRQLLS